MIRTYPLAVASLMMMLLVPSPILALGPANGSFETGDLTGWSSVGNGSIQVLRFGQLGPLTPVSGRYFALVGNGPGDVGNDGNPDMGLLQSNSFTVSHASSLEYSFDFLTSEFTGIDADPTHLDSFAISLLPQGGSPIQLESGDVSSLSFLPIDQGNAVAAPDGTSLIDHLGMQAGTYFMLPGTYSLLFQVNDAGDGSFDSAILADDVRFVEANNVPEASSLAYLIAGLMAMMVVRRRIRYPRKTDHAPPQS